MAKRSGVYVRPAPDWLFRSCAFASITGQPSSGNYGRVALYNNASVGTVLRVYGLVLSTSAAFDLVHLNLGEGVPALTEGGSGHSLNPLDVTPPGVLYYGDAASLPTADAEYPAPQDGVSLLPGWPLFIIPANWHASFTAGAADVTVNASLWYLVDSQ